MTGFTELFDLYPLTCNERFLDHVLELTGQHSYACPVLQTYCLGSGLEGSLSCCECQAALEADR